MNRHKAVDPVSELFNRINVKTTKNKFRKEISLLLIVGCIGCIGTMFIFNLFSWNNTTEGNDASTSITISNYKIANNQSNSFLDIQGETIVGKEIKFNIPNYNANAIYEIDFGDGIIEKSNTSTFGHQYEKAGTFQVKMNIHYRNQINTIFEKVLIINNQS